MFLGGSWGEGGTAQACLAVAPCVAVRPLLRGGSAVPARSLWPHLDELAVLLRGDEDLTLFVEGHTDTDGSEETNQRLSERRAEWVCDYLKEKRVRPEQLVSTGYGELRPLFDESRPGGKARNRRVELVLLSPHGELPLLEGME